MPTPTLPSPSNTIMTRRRLLAALGALGVIPLLGEFERTRFIPRAFAASAGVDSNQQGLTGAWYNPATSGQGFVIEAYQSLIDANTGLLFGGWFTFDTTAGGVETQRWYGITGLLVEGQSSVAVTIYQNTGG